MSTGGAFNHLLLSESPTPSVSSSQKNFRCFRKESCASEETRVNKGASARSLSTLERNVHKEHSQSQETRPFIRKRSASPGPSRHKMQWARPSQAEQAAAEAIAQANLGSSRREDPEDTIPGPGDSTQKQGSKFTSTLKSLLPRAAKKYLSKRKAKKAGIAVAKSRKNNNRVPNILDDE